MSDGLKCEIYLIHLKYFVTLRSQIMCPLYWQVQHLLTSPTFMKGKIFSLKIWSPNTTRPDTGQTHGCVIWGIWIFGYLNI